MAQYLYTKYIYEIGKSAEYLLSHIYFPQQNQILSSA